MEMQCRAALVENDWLKQKMTVQIGRKDCIPRNKYTTTLKMAARRPLQLTLALLKPDICANPLLPPKILDTIRARELNVLEQKTLLWSQSDAESFYGEHRGKFFFERLCGYMTRYLWNCI
jgi:hypothetical protein